MTALILKIQTQFAGRIYSKLIDGYLFLLETAGNLYINYRNKNHSTIKKEVRQFRARIYS